MSDNNPPSNDMLDTFDDSNNEREEYAQSFTQQPNQQLVPQHQLPLSILPRHFDGQDLQLPKASQYHSLKPSGQDKGMVSSSTSNNILSMKKKLSTKKASSTRTLIKMSKLRSKKFLQALKDSSIKFPKSVLPASTQSQSQVDGTQTFDTTFEMGLTIYQEMQTIANQIHQSITKGEETKNQLNKVVDDFSNFDKRCATELNTQKTTQSTVDGILEELFQKCENIVKEFNHTIAQIRTSLIILKGNAKILFSQGYQENIQVTNQLSKQVWEQCDDIATILEQLLLKQGNLQKEIEVVRDYAISQFDILTKDVSKQFSIINSNIHSITNHFIKQNTQLTNFIKQQQDTFDKNLKSVVSQLQPKLQLTKLEYKIDISDLRKSIHFQRKQFKQLQIKTDITYFKCNTLIDNTKLLKQGITHSIDKVNNVVDLVQNTKNLITNHLQQPLKNELNSRFNDFVISLVKAEKPLDFPNVDKVRSFLKDEQSLEYAKQYELFAKNHPKQTIVFINLDFIPDQNNDEKVEDDDVPQSTHSFPQFNIPKTSKITFDTTPPLFLKFKPTPKLSFPTLVSTPPVQQNSPIVDDNKTSFHKYMAKASRFEKDRANNVSYVPVQEKKMHKFQFRTTFNRQLDPVIWMYQYETQCYFSPQDKCTQLVNVLQGEYLDWYKQRLRSFTGKDTNQNILKSAFLNQYTKPLTQAKEELFECKQYPNESLHAFVERMRAITRTFELDDSHIKDQLVRGMRDRWQRMYVTQIQEYTKNQFDEYTSTTLVEKIEKHTKKFRLQDSFKVLEKKLTTPPKPYFKPKITWKNKLPLANVKPFDKKPPPRVNATTKDFSAKPTADPKSTSKQAVNEEFMHKVNMAFQNLFDNDFIEAQYAKSHDVVDDSHSPYVSAIWVFDRLTFDQVNIMIESLKTAYFVSKQIFRDFVSLSGKTTNAMNNHSKKLYSFADKDKELPKLSYDQFRSSQHIYLPKKQLLKESPYQFSSTVSYLHDILEDTNNYLNTPTTLIVQQNFMTSIASRNSNLLFSRPEPVQPQVTTIQVGEKYKVDETIAAVLHAKPINFLCYIHIVIQGIKISAMVDSGSTATIISKRFFKDRKQSLLEAKFYRCCILADGSQTIMFEWNDIPIRLDKFLQFKCDMLISKNVNFEMIFGLNALHAISGNLTTSKLKYSYENNGKKWGSVPLIKIYGANKSAPSPPKNDTHKEDTKPKTQAVRQRGTIRRPLSLASHRRRRDEQRKLYPDFPIHKKYDVILLYPPYKYDVHTQPGIIPDYDTLALLQLMLLPIRVVAKEDLILLMWCTSPMLNKTMQLIKSFGFRYVIVFQTWVKKQNGDLAKIKGNYSSAQIEYLLWADKGRTQNLRTLDIVDQVLTSDIIRHSEKPNELLFPRLMQKLHLNKCDCLEIFAREKKLQYFDVYGNQLVPQFQEYIQSLVFVPNEQQDTQPKSYVPSIAKNDDNMWFKNNNIEQTRLPQILSKFDGHKHIQRLTKIFEKIQHTIALSKFELGISTIDTHKITLKEGFVPKRSHSYRLSPLELEFLKKEIDVLEELGFIKRCECKIPLVYLVKKVTTSISKWYKGSY